MNLRILTVGVAISLLAACGGKEPGAKAGNAIHRRHETLRPKAHVGSVTPWPIMRSAVSDGAKK